MLDKNEKELVKVEMRFLIAGIVLAILSFIVWFGARNISNVFLFAFGSLAIPGFFVASVLGVTRSLSVLFVAAIVDVLLYGALFYGIGIFARRFGWKAGLSVIVVLASLFFYRFVLGVIKF